MSALAHDTNPLDALVAELVEDVARGGRLPAAAVDARLPRAYEELDAGAVYALARTGLIRMVETAHAQYRDALAAGYTPRSGRFYVGGSGSGRHSAAAIRYRALQKPYPSADGGMKRIIDFTLEDAQVLLATLDGQIAGLREVRSAVKLTYDLLTRYEVSCVTKLPAPAKEELDAKFGGTS